MAEIWGAALVAAGSAYAANKQAKGAKEAAKLGNQGAQAGIDEQRRQFDIFQGNIQPYLGAGTDALSQLQALNAGDYSGFNESPDYRFAYDQGLQALDRSAAAGGALYSGGADADRIAFGQGLASQQYNNYYNKISDLARLGQNSAVGAGSLGQSSANAISGLYGQMGQNNANAAIGSANAWSNGIAGIAGAIGQYAGSRQSSYQPPSYSGNWGAFTPTQQAGYGTLGPSNGSYWNFGGG